MGALGVGDGQPLSTEPATRPAKQFTATARPEMIADRDQVLAATVNNNISLIDTPNWITRVERFREKKKQA